MDKERVYSEQEIAAIFKQAAEDFEAVQQGRPQRGGLTLAELQRIGAEAGIPPAFIARASAALDDPVPEPVRTTIFGLREGASRSIDLPASFSDADWERLVVDLRRTFQEAGEVVRDGSLRTWQSPSMEAYVEPAGSGYRLRMHTRNENLKSGFWGGVALVLAGLFMAVLIAAKGKLGVDMGATLIPVFFAAGGVIWSAIVGMMLPRKTAEQDRQLAAIAAGVYERFDTQEPVVDAEGESIRVDPLPEPEPPSAAPERRRARS
ncbi:MAG: hypothetical protein R2834_19690 [Rhodothermales bacterium]